MFFVFKKKFSAQSSFEEVKAARHHTLYEDLYGLFIGITFVAIGLHLLKAAGLVTGGIAGIALLVSYLLKQPVGLIFTLVNIPFFVFAFFSMGFGFAIKTIVASAGVSLMLVFMPQLYSIASIHTAFAAIMGGTLSGMGILALARHGAGVGGTGVVTLWLQRIKGINAGRTQIGIDCVILLVSAFLFPLDRIFWSAVSAAAMSAMVMAWHKPGRYNS